MRYLTKPLITLSICILGSITFGQKYTPAWARDVMWNNDDPNFEITEVPEKWKDESAVILYESTIYEFKKQSMAAKVNNDIYHRKRIKILDKSAVNDNAEFSFETLTDRAFSREGEFLGIKIIKPDGTTHEIDLESSVQMDKYSNSRESYQVDEGYHKLALPDLEIGDIIDYYYVIINSIPTKYTRDSKRFEFEPIIKVLPENYPILNGKLGFLAERRCFINLGVSNGAPEPIVKTIDEKPYYLIEYGDLEKTEPVIWSSPLLLYPSVRFQVITAPPSVSEYEKQFLSEPEIMKTSVDEEELHRLLKILSNQFRKSKSDLEKRAYKYIGNKNQTTSAETIVEELFYYLRHKLHFNYTYHWGFYSSVYKAVDRYAFTQAYSKILSERNIEHSVFLGVPKTLGELESVVFLDEITSGIRFEGEDGVKYILEPERHSVFGEIPSYLQGTKILLVDVHSDEISDPYYDSIPMMPSSENYEHDVVNITIDTLNEGKINLKLHSITGGTVKERFASLMLMPDLYYRDEYRQYIMVYPLTNYEQSRILEYVDYLEENKDDFIEYQNEKVETYLKDMLAIEEVELDTIIQKQLGRSSEQAEIEFELKASSAELISKTGDYIIIDAGQFIGTNINLSERDKERTEDVHMPSAREFKSSVTIRIPKGYEPANLDEFNISVSNETGCFSSKVDHFGQLVMLNTVKKYYRDYEPVSNWPLMLEFMDAANEFVQKKLVLKRID